MAPSTLYALPQKELSSVFDARFDIVHLSKPTQRVDASQSNPKPSGSLEQTDHMVCFVHASLDPLMKRKGSKLTLCIGSTIPKDGIPFICEEVCILFAFQKAIDPMSPFRRGCIAEELFGLFERR